MDTIFTKSRMSYFFSLLTIFVAAYLLLPERASMQTDAPPFSDAPAQPDALGRLAFQRLNFSSAGGGTVSLLAVNADGTNQATLAAAGTPPLFCGEPSYSPDGARIAYVTDGDIYVMNADGSNKVNLTNNGGGALFERNPWWSATNKIAYERESQIWTMNADGSNQTRFTALTQAAPLAPAWSPDGTKMAFASGGEIWVINADGTGERRVTNNSTTDADPAWSPDGSKIIFGKGGSGIAVVNLDGTNEANLTNNAADGKPAWSNDGTKIAFVRRIAGEGGIFVMDVNGANPIRVVADQASQPGRNENDNPAWQPVGTPANTFTISGRITRSGIGLNNVTVNLSGTTTATTTTNTLGFFQFSNLAGGGNYRLTPTASNFVFTPPNRVFSNLNAVQIADFTAAGTGGCSSGNCFVNGRIVYNRAVSAGFWNIATINPDGTGRTDFALGAANYYEPSYSPDGSKIVYYREDFGGLSGIYRVNADGSGNIRLTSGNDRFPTYSQDGASIVFVRNSGIYRMNAEGSNVTQLTAQSGDNHPTYSPDGTKIAFTRSNRVYTMNADGTNPIQLTNEDSQAPSYSPDGRNIVFARTGDIFVMNADGSNQTVIYNGGIISANPSYSPDGTKILFYNLRVSGSSEIVTMNTDGSGAAMIGYGLTADWQPLRQRRTPFDFDGDGRADVSLFRPANGTWYILPSQTNGFYGFPFGQSGDLIAPADYDGDGKTDVAVFRPVVPGAGDQAYFYILNSSDNSFRAVGFGTQGDQPVSGDWDGDGKADVAVYREAATVGAQSNFYYRPSSQPTINFNTIPLETPSGKALVGDFDGDGKQDAAVFRVLPATWMIRRSSDDATTQTAFGVSTDIPTPADFDGDGKTNIAVFRPSNGTWYTSQNPATNYGAIVFGSSGDLPVPADYDGDGKADAAVFRPSNGGWFLNRSTSGLFGVQFGAGGDKPSPNAYIR